MSDGEPVAEEPVRELARLLLSHAFLLPPSRVADDAAFLALTGASPETADVPRLCEIAQLVSGNVSGYVAPDVAEMISALSAQLLASHGRAAGSSGAGPESGPAPAAEPQPVTRTIRARPATLQDAVVLRAVAEFKPQMNERAQEKFREFEATLSESSPPRDWSNLSLFCGGLAKAIAPELTATDRRLRLWQIAWWAVRQELREADHNRVSNRLNQLAGVLDAFPVRMRESLVAAYYNDFSALVRANAKQQFLEWFAGVLESAPEAELRELHAQSVARLAELADRGAERPQTQPQAQAQAQPGAPTATPPERLELFQQVWGGPLTRTEAVDAIIAGWAFLDAKKEEQNREKLEKARAADGNASAAQLAHGALRSALWRCRRLDAGHADAFTAENLALAVALARVVYQYSHPHRGNVVAELTSLFGMTVLVRELVSPQGYIRFIDLLAESAPEDNLRDTVRRAGAEELLGYLTGRAGLQVLTRNPEPWAEAASEWAARYSGADRERLLEILVEAGAPESLSLHALRVSAVPSADADSSSIFGPADAAEFEQHYQEGRLQPIAELLQRNHGRLLAVTEKDLSAVDYTEFLSPSGWVYIAGPDKKNIFSEVRKKALSGDSAQVLDAHNAFDRALRHAQGEEVRRTLAEWKAYTLKARSVLEAERVWAEAADNGTASKEVLWNLAVYRNRGGTPWRGLRYLAPGIAAKNFPLSYVQFGCVLAVATLLATSEADESDPLREENRMARRFILDHGRMLPVASVHLLWFWLAYFDQQQALGDEASRALVTYTALRDQPDAVLTAVQVARKSGNERVQAVDQVGHYLQGFGDPYFRLTWRLWIAEYAELNRTWWPAWDKWATACTDDHDPGAAVHLLRRAAQSAVKDLRNNRLKDSDRDSRANFLRSAVLRLLRFAQDLRRDSLREEIRDRYVQPVPELNVKNSKNAYLQQSLGLSQVSAAPGEEQTQSPNRDVWRSLQVDLAAVQDLSALDEALARRIEAAATVDPGTTGRAGPVVESILGLLRDIFALHGGVPEDQFTGVLLRLSNRTKRVLEEVDAAHLVQLVAPLRVFERVLKDLADSRDVAPRPQIRLADGWAGWPAEYGASSLPVEISFPGPGSATAVRVTGGWDCLDYRPAAEVRGVRDLAAGEADAYALPLTAPAGDTGQARVEVTYSWGPLTGLSASAVLDVPRCTFSEYLAGRGIAAYEFPNPFVFDKALDAEQVQSALFQGRDTEVAEVRSSYGQGRFPPLPLSFYGIRRTGKTSLLHRVALEVERAGLIALEVNIYGFRANAQTTDQLFLGLLSRVKESAVKLGADPEALPVPLEHPNPALLVGEFFRRLSECFGGRKVVVLLDEYQFLLMGPNGEPVLDSLRPVHEEGQVGFIAFSNQGLDPMNKTGSQLGLRSIRVDFLKESEVGRLVENPLSPLGVYVHPSAQREIFALAVGHPNFSAWLASGALDRLNLDHRNVITVSDVAASAADILNHAHAFATSWFSSQNITAAEAEIAIRLAKEDNSYTGLELAQAGVRLGLTTEVARDLEGKRVVEYKAPNLRIRGRLLWEYLRGQVSVGEVPPAPSGSADSVGLFVDLENLRPHKPEGMSYYEFGKKLIGYAATLGDLKSRWIAIASWNTGEDWGRVKADLFKAGFLIAQEPATFSPRRHAEKRDAADIVLTSTVYEDLLEQGLTRIVIVTGDGDFLMLVNTLLDKWNVSVRLISGDDQSRAKAYVELADQQRRAAFARGLQSHEAGFDTLLLAEILSADNP